MSISSRVYNAATTDRGIVKGLKDAVTKDRGVTSSVAKQSGTYNMKEMNAKAKVPILFVANIPKGKTDNSYYNESDGISLTNAMKYADVEVVNDVNQLDKLIIANDYNASVIKNTEAVNYVNKTFKGGKSKKRRHSKRKQVRKSKTSKRFRKNK